MRNLLNILCLACLLTQIPAVQADVQTDLKNRLPLEQVYRNALTAHHDAVIDTTRDLLTNGRRYAKSFLRLLFRHHAKYLKPIMALAIELKIPPTIIVRAALEALPDKVSAIQQTALDLGLQPNQVRLEIKAFESELQRRAIYNQEIRAQQPAIIEPSNHSGGTDLASPN